MYKEQMMAAQQIKSPPGDDTVLGKLIELNLEIDELERSADMLIDSLSSVSLIATPKSIAENPTPSHPVTIVNNLNNHLERVKRVRAQLVSARDHLRIE